VPRKAYPVKVRRGGQGEQIRCNFEKVPSFSGHYSYSSRDAILEMDFADSGGLGAVEHRIVCMH
jgi:hypothetical protein